MPRDGFYKDLSYYIYPHWTVPEYRGGDPTFSHGVIRIHSLHPPRLLRALFLNSPHQNDDSLRRWKESLGIGSGKAIVANPNDPRTAIIDSLALEVEGRADIVVDLRAPGALEQLKSRPFTIREGARFRMKCRFHVQRQLLSGLKYIQVLKRKGIRVAKDEEMLGSYPPNTEDNPSYEKRFAAEEAPSGIMARGHYDAVCKFIDDDLTEHLKFAWSFDIKKDW
ncbi:MAG: hypothetical protein M1826_000650 [Phylliscum demangeonii]|nr:MAG: hypothetical protein M1826_000650 [Phylliscum demangeonii]